MVRLVSYIWRVQAVHICMGPTGAAFFRCALAAANLAL